MLYGGDKDGNRRLVGGPSGELVVAGTGARAGGRFEIKDTRHILKIRKWEEWGGLLSGGGEGKVHCSVLAMIVLRCLLDVEMESQVGSCSYVS